MYVVFLTGREDLAKQKCSAKQSSSPILTAKQSTPHVKGLNEEEDGMEHLDHEVMFLKLLCL